MTNGPKIPSNIIDRQTAIDHHTTDDLAAIWLRCASHLVAECTTCATVWRLDQLAHPNIGYYPGDPVAKPLFPEPTGDARTRGDVKHGPRFADNCPLCWNDLTQAVVAHFLAHELAPPAAPTSSPPPTA